MTQTPVGADLLQSLQIITELAVDTVGEHLEVLAVDNVALPVEEPGWDLVLGWVLEDRDNALEFFGGKLAGAAEKMLVCGHNADCSMIGMDIRCVVRNGGVVGIVPLVEVDIGLLADQVAVSATDTLDLGHGVHDLLLAIDLHIVR